MSAQKYKKILSAFSFLRLNSPDIYLYQWIYPTFIAIIFLILSFFVKPGSEAKLIGDINSLMGTMVGFYIAALAAVSSFTNEYLDKKMKGRAPELLSKRQGNVIKEVLTRRRFLSILFGYCAALSIFIYMFGVLQTHLEVKILSINIVNGTLWVMYIWCLASLLVVTLLGLHYLVERMHRA